MGKNKRGKRQAATASAAETETALKAREAHAHMAREAAAAAGGQSSGGGLGSLGGPPGAVVGALLGLAVVAVAEESLESAAVRAWFASASVRDDSTRFLRASGMTVATSPPANRAHR